MEPSRAIILVGEDPASHLYVRKKEEACLRVGIIFHKYLFEADVAEQSILDCINFLNQDETVDAILVQLPLPTKFDEDKIIKAIKPTKDVDGFHPANAALLMNDKPRLISGLILGVLKLLETTGEDIKGKKALIIAHSPVFTKPLKHLLEQRGATATIISNSDQKLNELSQAADILISAIGKPGYIKGSMVKQDAIIIDIGISKTKEGKTVGDVNFEEVEKIAGHITPVPGGVGPVTVAMLLHNTLELAKATHDKS